MTCNRDFDQGESWRRLSWIWARPTAKEAREEYTRIEQAILTWNVAVLEECGGVQAALKRSGELKQLARKRIRKTVIEGFATSRQLRITGVGC